MQEPFRCTVCGAPSEAETHCAGCGAARFELAPAPVHVREAEPEGAELVSLQDIRAERARRTGANRD